MSGRPALAAMLLVVGCASPPAATSEGEESTGDEGCPELVFVGGSTLHVESVEDAEVFPPYTRIEGRLIVSIAPGLVDLRFLECLESAWSLNIVSLPDLTSLTGLEQLEVVDAQGYYVNYDFNIVNNPRLEDVAGLRNLEHVGSLVVSDNAILESLDGFESLASAGSIWITDNPALETVGMRALETGYVHIGWMDCGSDGPIARGNPALVEIDGLDALSMDVAEVSGNANLLSLANLPDHGKWTAVELNASLPYADILALDEARSSEFLTCGNLDEPEACVCPPGEVP